VDLSRRITEGGLRLYHLAEAKVIHTGAGATSKVPGKFSVIMQCESIGKLIEKNYGHGGRLMYRAAVFLRAFSRLILLSCLRFLAVLGSSKRSPSLKASFEKQVAMLKWSIGVLCPSIPK
jgi:hypothetical protein